MVVRGDSVVKCDGGRGDSEVKSRWWLEVILKSSSDGFLEVTLKSSADGKAAADAIFRSGE